VLVVVLTQPVVSGRVLTKQSIQTLMLFHRGAVVLVLPVPTDLTVVTPISVVVEAGGVHLEAQSQADRVFMAARVVRVETPEHNRRQELRLVAEVEEDRRQPMVRMAHEVKFA
jgi:hypothetical protein